MQAELEELFASENQNGRGDVTEISAVYLCALRVLSTLPPLFSELCHA
jgi:hypothetical protein